MTFCIHQNSWSVEVRQWRKLGFPYPMSKSAATLGATAQGSTALGTALAFLSSFVVVSFAVQVIASAPQTSESTVLPHQATLWSTLGQS